MEDSNLYGKAFDVDKRGRHTVFSKAVDSVMAELKSQLAEKNEFFDSLVDRWPQLFPSLKAAPGRYEDGILFLYVRSAPLLFAIRPRLALIHKTLAELPGAPKKLALRLEIHTS